MHLLPPHGLRSVHVQLSGRQQYKDGRLAMLPLSHAAATEECLGVASVQKLAWIFPQGLMPYDAWAYKWVPVSQPVHTPVPLLACHSLCCCNATQRNADFLSSHSTTDGCVHDLRCSAESTLQNTQTHTIASASPQLHEPCAATTLHPACRRHCTATASIARQHAYFSFRTLTAGTRGQAWMAGQRQP